MSAYAYYTPVAKGVTASGDADIVSGTDSDINFKPAGTLAWSFDSDGNLQQEAADLYIGFVEGAAPGAGAASAGTAQLYSAIETLSGGTKATFGFRTEATVEAEVIADSTHVWIVTINGTDYKVLLSAA